MDPTDLKQRCIYENHFLEFQFKNLFKKFNINIAFNTKNYIIKSLLLNTKDKENKLDLVSTVDSRLSAELGGSAAADNKKRG